jgi:hypothetical protein
MAAAADDRFKFEAVVALDPAVQSTSSCCLSRTGSRSLDQDWNPGTATSLNPCWSSTRKNSRSAQTLPGSQECQSRSTTAPSLRLVGLLGLLMPDLCRSVPAGSTHPSFSDIHLILPRFINRRIGLKTEADYILDVTIHAIELFFDTHDLDDVRPLAEQRINARPGRPLPRPGTVLLYDSREDYLSPSTSTASFKRFASNDTQVQLERVMSG